MSVTLRKLRIFEATARLGRLTSAAEELAVSQSAASQALKELEAALDFQLFERSGRDLILTHAAQNILFRVRNILDLSQGLKRHDSAGISGSLRIVASVTIGSYILPNLLSKFMDLHPGIEPDIRITNSRQVIEQLEKSWAHIGMIEGPAVHNRLKITPWMEDSLEIFCHSEHPLAERRELTVDQIQQQRWVLRETGSGTRAVFDHAIQKAGSQIKLALELNRQEAIKQSVKVGLGVGCLSQLSIKEEVQGGELITLRTPLDLRRRFALVTHLPGNSNFLATSFAEFLAEQVS